MTTVPTNLNLCVDKLDTARSRCDRTSTLSPVIEAVALLAEHVRLRVDDQLVASIANLCARVEVLESMVVTQPSWATESPDRRLYGAEARTGGRADEPPRAYLGDSVYARFDGYAIVLYLDNGYGPQNEIALEPEVYATLIRFAERVRFTERTGSAHHD